MTEPRSDVSPGVRAVGQSVAALAGFAVGGPAGAVLGAAGADPLVRLAAKAWDELRAARASNVATLVGETAAKLEQDPEQLVADALGTVESSQLFYEALKAAAETLTADKIDALSESLAAGLAEPSLADREVLMIRALADLEPLHVRVLATVETSYNSDINAVVQGLMTPGESPLKTYDFVAPVLATLDRHGLITTQELEPRSSPIAPKNTGFRVPITGPTLVYYNITDFGRACLRRLNVDSASP